jgi:pimeloyl-ACP methyl ester carboxylesterase
MNGCRTGMFLKNIRSTIETHIAANRSTDRNGTHERLRVLTVGEGTEIHTWIATPPGKATPPAVLLLCHGFATDALEHGSFSRLRNKALSCGLAVVRFDFRGHGSSGGANHEIRLASMRIDVEGVIRLIDDEFGLSTPIIPVGLSFGAGPAVHAAAIREPCAGLALWYPVVDYEWNFGRASKVPAVARMRAAKHATDPPWSDMPILGTEMYFPIKLVREFPFDPTVTVLSKLRQPVLVYHGRRDRLVDARPIRQLATATGHIELRMVPGAGHGFRLSRPWVIHRTVSWCEQLVR